jgi:O-succinylbenzoate synthase
MRDGFKVLDADRHVLEPSDLYDRYLPERFRGRVRIERPNQALSTSAKLSVETRRKILWDNPARLYGFRS